MNRPYADKCEDIDFELMKDFNSKLKLKQLAKTEYMHATDVSGYTEDNRLVEIELKNRNIKHDTYDTIMIEPYKLDYARHQDSIQLYVNFTNDEHVIVFNLHNVGKLNERDFNIPSKLYERVKKSKRYEIPIEKAWIYQKIDNTYNLVQKGV